MPDLGLGRLAGEAHGGLFGLWAPQWTWWWREIGLGLLGFAGLLALIWRSIRWRRRRRLARAVRFRPGLAADP